MAVQAFNRQPIDGGELFARLFRDAFSIMRERWFVYVAFAAVCAASAFVKTPQSLLEIAAYNPGMLIRVPPVNVILLLALLAIFFVLPSALRRVDTKFRMTFWRAAITLVMIASVALVTDVGLVSAVIPGMVIAVLLSQALIAALLRAPERPSPKGIAATILGALRGSFEMTKGHFATTAGIFVLSLAIVVIPSLVMLFAMFVLAYRMPSTLVFMSPLLFLTFIYFECVRYTLVVRWYQRLNRQEATALSHD